MSQLAGAGRLTRFALRLDAWKLVPWIAIIALFPLASYSAYDSLFPTPRDAVVLEVSLQTNPAFTLLFGHATNLETAAGFTTWRIQVFGMFFTALMAIFTVTRHARASEDTGQAELVDSGAVGQHARLASGVLLAWAASAAVAALIAGTLTAAGAAPEDALALGGMLGGMGIAFAGVAAVTAQIGSYARTANALAAAVLVASYVLRGLGDTLEDAEWLLWTNPMGWAELIRPAAENNPGPLALLAAVGIATAAVGARLARRRDFGAGLLRQGTGPDRSTAGISRHTVRLSRGPIASWLATSALLGFVYGIVAGTMSGFFSENPFVQQILAARAATEEDLVFAFVQMLTFIMAIIAAVFGVQLALRFAVEEDERRSEWVLSAPLARARYLAPTVAAALGAPTVAVAVSGTVLGTTAVATGTRADAWLVLLQTLAHAPAVWLAAALALALVGAAPQLRWIAWLALVYWIVLTLFGPVLKAPDWLMDTSPFHVIPRITADDADWAPVVVVLAIAVVLITAGFAAYRRRDLRTV
ncbi:ABC transporter permease [Sinomonas mesophila]|uniref:ABC transporter permease n=1 Tax=Sinomonas mesophila TaxID=1531955 RepID=UPI0009865142|nr:hypothetical protein [Sinomonas mesophila]